MKAEARLPNLRAWFDHVHEECDDNQMREAFDGAVDIAREAIALLREVDDRMICTEDYVDHSRCGDCRLIRRLRAFLDGEKEEAK